MTTDLFTQTKSKKDQLRDYILSRNFTKSSEVIAWGLKNYHIRAMRDAQEMCVAGVFRRMTQDEMKFYFPLSKEGVYVPNEFK